MGGIIDVMGPGERLSRCNEQELVIKKEQELKLLGGQKRIPGHKLFSFNVKTGEIKEASYQQSLIIWNPKTGEIQKKKEVLIEGDCFYYQALNEKNFIKKLIKFGFIVKANE